MMNDQSIVEAKSALAGKLLGPAVMRASVGEPSPSPEQFLRGAASHAGGMGASHVRHSGRLAVHAVGIGSNGTNQSRSRLPVMRVYVDRRVKYADSYIKEQIPTNFHGFQVIVINSVPARFLTGSSMQSCTDLRKEPQRPVVAGTSTSHYGGDVGTLGYFCASAESQGSPREVFVLSNNHIYANWNKAKVGDKLFQPARGDGGNSAGAFAMFARAAPLQFGGHINRVDAALGKLDPGIQYRLEICGIGKVSSPGVAREQQLVVMHGRTSGYSEGIVIDELIDTNLLGSNGEIARFENQIRIDPIPGQKSIAKAGDSGSIFVDKVDRSAVGLLFAAAEDGSYAYANHVGDVLSSLGIVLL